MKPEVSTKTQLEIAAQPIRVELYQNTTIFTINFLLLPLMLIAVLFLLNWCIQAGEFWLRKQRDRQIIIQLQGHQLKAGQKRRRRGAPSSFLSRLKTKPNFNRLLC
jgi:hypothetical protein